MMWMTPSQSFSWCEHSNLPWGLDIVRFSFFLDLSHLFLWIIYNSSQRLIEFLRAMAYILPIIYRAVCVKEDVDRTTKKRMPSYVQPLLFSLLCSSYSVLVSN